MKLLGKALIANKNTSEGKPVIMLCGVFNADEAPELKELIGDEFNIALLEIHVKDIATIVPRDDVVGSPEDFLRGADKYDWKYVIKEGKRLKGI